MKEEIKSKPNIPKEGEEGGVITEGRENSENNRKELRERYRRVAFPRIVEWISTKPSEELSRETYYDNFREFNDEQLLDIIEKMTADDFNRNPAYYHAAALRLKRHLDPDYML
jgi:hypothetical protein